MAESLVAQWAREKAEAEQYAIDNPHPCGCPSDTVESFVTGFTGESGEHVGVWQCSSCGTCNHYSSLDGF